MSKNTWKHKTRRYIPHIVIWYINILIYYINLCMVIQCHTVSYSIYFPRYFRVFSRPVTAPRLEDSQPIDASLPHQHRGGCFCSVHQPSIWSQATKVIKELRALSASPQAWKFWKNWTLPRDAKSITFKKPDKKWQISDIPLSKQPARATSWHQELALGRAAAKASLILDALPDSGFSDGMGEARK